MDKSSTPKAGTPKFFKKLLRWFCAPELLEELEGDLEESFEYQRSLIGLRRARYRYAREVIGLFRPSVIRKLNYNNINSSIMIANYGKVAFRNFLRNKTYVLINILSMSIGLACCIVSYLNYEHNNTFDHQHANIDNIYRINYQQLDGNRLRNYGVVPVALATASEQLSNVSEVVRYVEWHGNAKIEEEYFDMNIGYVSDNFLDVLTFHLHNGSREALKRKSSILITEPMALRLFGELDVTGKTLTLAHQGQEKSFTIEGILDKIPSNSSFNVDALLPIENFQHAPLNSEWQTTNTTFLLLKDSRIKQDIEDHLIEFAAKHTPATTEESPKEYYLDPLKGMAARAQANDVIGPLEVAWPIAMEIVPGIISLLILLIACFTFTNTSIASAASRLKEIGIRKVMGGRKSQVVIQFLGESLLICLFAILMAIPIANFLAGQYNQLLPFLEIELTLSNSLGFFSFMAALLLLAGLIAGSYPALYLSKFQPSKILKGNLKYKSVGRLIKVLLTGQFAFSMLTITASILFIRNAQYQNEIDLGFDTEQTIVIRFGDDKNIYQPLHSALSTNPKISMLTGSVDHVGKRYHNATVTHESETIDIVGLDVGTNYLETMELKLTEGRDFDRDRASDYEESVIINERFVKIMGWDNPIGQKLTYQDSLNYYVIGVVQDFYFDSFESPIQPLWLRFKKPEEYNYLIAKTTPEMVPSVMAEIKMTWRDLFNTEARDVKPAEYARDQAQTINGIILKILIFMGSIAAIMSMIGFYSLVSLNLFGRMKEIGVRRVLGSSIGSIIQVINKDYILILSIGIISGSFISYFLIPLFMGSIWATHINGDIGLTLLSIGLMLIIGVVTVGVRVVRASSVNPVNLLRDE